MAAAAIGVTVHRHLETMEGVETLVEPAVRMTARPAGMTRVAAHSAPAALIRRSMTCRAIRRALVLDLGAMEWFGRVLPVRRVAARAVVAIVAAGHDEIAAQGRSVAAGAEIRPLARHSRTVKIAAPRIGPGGRMSAQIVLQRCRFGTAEHQDQCPERVRPADASHRHLP